jgi:hypothetical protein
MGVLVGEDNKTQKSNNDGRKLEKMGEKFLWGGGGREDTYSKYEQRDIEKRMLTQTGFCLA